MKNILVLAGGEDSDEAVFVTALAAARQLGAHLAFCHLQVPPGEAAAWEPHSEFVRGAGVREMMVKGGVDHAHRYGKEPLRAVLRSLRNCHRGRGPSQCRCFRKLARGEGRHQALDVLGQASRSNRRWTADRAEWPAP